MEDIIIKTEKDSINISIPRGFVSTKEIKNILSEYFTVKRILKKSKAKQKDINTLAKEANKNITKKFKLIN